MSALDTLRAGVLRNKVPIGAGGVAVVGLLAWRARTAKASSSAAPAAAAGTSAVPSSYSVGTQTAGATGYDSTASDVYNAIQPQLEQLRNLWSNNQSSPIPVPAAPAAAAPSTNQDWINSAISGWAGLGRNPIDIQAALSQYVAGAPINQYQTPGIEWAVQKYGAAPQGVAGTSPTVTV
jgi:hypothetical protein